MSIERLGNVLPRRNEQQQTSAGSAPESVAAGARLDPDPGAHGSRKTVVIKVEADVAVNGSEATAPDPGTAAPDPEAEAVEFVRFCYRRRAVAWPELYDEMCAVAARGDYRGMSYEQLERLGIGFALAALPRLAEMVARVIAEERGPQAIPAVA